MKLKKLSATAANSAEGCLARYKADRDHGYQGQMQNEWAKLGSIFHNTVQMYVQDCYVDKVTHPREDFLKDCFEHTFKELVPAGDPEMHDEAWRLIHNWWKRTSFEGFTVLSVEQKEQFMIKTSQGDIPFTYIIDRLDLMNDGSLRVVDYKTSSWYLNAADLKDKLQARSYALAMQLKYPDHPGFWVEFDMIRHEGPVGVYFTKDMNRDTYRHLRSVALRIMAADEENPPETVNMECNFCIRKTQCEALNHHVSADGVLGMSMQELVERRHLLWLQIKGSKAAVEEMDKRIEKEMEDLDLTDYDTGMVQLDFSISRRRSIDPDIFRDIVGPDIAGQYMDETVTMKQLDALLKSQQLDEATKKRLENAIVMTVGTPSPRTKFKK